MILLYQCFLSIQDFTLPEHSRIIPLRFSTKDKARRHKEIVAKIEMTKKNINLRPQKGLTDPRSVKKLVNQRGRVMQNDCSESVAGSTNAVYQH